MSIIVLLIISLFVVAIGALNVFFIRTQDQNLDVMDRVLRDEYQRSAQLKAQNDALRRSLNSMAEHFYPDWFADSLIVNGERPPYHNITISMN